MYSGRDFLNRRVVRTRRNVASDSADVMYSGRLFQVCRRVTREARLPTVDSLLVGTTRRFVPTEDSYRWWVGRWHVWKGRGTPAQVRGQLCMSRRRSWTQLSQGRAANGWRRPSEMWSYRRRWLGQARSRVQHWLESSDQIFGRPVRTLLPSIVQTS